MKNIIKIFYIIFAIVCSENYVLKGYYYDIGTKKINNQYPSAYFTVEQNAKKYLKNQGFDATEKETDTMEIKKNKRKRMNDAKEGVKNSSYDLQYFNRKNQSYNDVKHIESIDYSGKNKTSTNLSIEELDKGSKIEVKLQRGSTLLGKATWQYQIKNCPEKCDKVKGPGCFNYEGKNKVFKITFDTSKPKGKWVSITEKDKPKKSDPCTCATTLVPHVGKTKDKIIDLRFYCNKP